jgi:hypothetical protein
MGRGFIILSLLNIICTLRHLIEFMFHSRYNKTQASSLHYMLNRISGPTLLALVNFKSFQNPMLCLASTLICRQLCLCSVC